MALGRGPKVVKHCAEGHVMDMAWLTCPRCTGRKAQPELPGRDMTELTMVDGAPVIVPAPPPVEQPVWVALLSPAAGPAVGRDFQIPPGRWKVGRAPREEAGFQLVAVPDPSMSRDHFVLEAGFAAVVLRDLGSTNGTRVNGERVERHILQDGDVVNVGQTALRVRLALRSPTG